MLGRRPCRTALNTLSLNSFDVTIQIKPLRQNVCTVLRIYFAKISLPVHIFLLQPAIIDLEVTLKLRRPSLPPASNSDTVV